MKLLKGFFVIIPAIIYISCNNTELTNSGPDEVIHGSGKIISQIRITEPFTGFIVNFANEIHISRDTIQSVRIEADDNIIDSVETNTTDNVLQMGLKRGNYSDVTVNIYITLPTINKITINGSSLISFTDSITCGDLLCTINGAGKINISGKGEYIDCKINGAGEINAQKFIVKKCKAIISGAGKCIIFVTSELDASVFGTGSIIYYGNPPIISTYISGVGSIIKM